MIVSNTSSAKKKGEGALFFTLVDLGQIRCAWWCLSHSGFGPWQGLSAGVFELDQVRKTLGSPSVCFCLWPPPSCKHNYHLCPGGPAPRTPPRARSREPSFFFTIKSSGVYQDFPVQNLPFFSPGLGLREGWLRLIRYRFFLNSTKNVDET